MINILSTWPLIGFMLVNILTLNCVRCDVNWNGNNWAMSCDFRGNDLSNVQIASEFCGGKCAETQRCTHFTWTQYNGGTCWMKSGTVSKSDAFSTSDPTMVCGVMSDTSTVQWNGNNWAVSCDFRGNDLSNVQIASQSCGSKCAETQGCTHFTWTQYNGGTCWMKSGTVSKSDAFSTSDSTTVCGVVDGSSPNSGLGPLLSGVLATRHGAYESGACALPNSNYAVVNPVALGDIGTLQQLKFRPDLCGHVLKVDCGNGPLDIVITNSNYGGGLDLYGSTWSKLTNNKPPGQTYCSVQLTSRNAFSFQEPRCYYKPGTDYNNPYYHNVGLLNTGGRIVRGASIDNRAGQHRGDNPYYAFDFGPIDGNKQVVFTFEDGTTSSVFLRDCTYQGSEQMWS
ncbi:unnamed protein product [Rotaria sordida]|uniref:Apple domain-containing protein n=2 Tax=Rotaria sordida TaxID=392033 RepID=A0A815UTD3_9BILA|nr:unnamed protein product [Rotaria sordida]